MQAEIIISGFGGQGVLFAGQLLAYTALENGKQVTWFPSYGPEMRGGTAHCTVIMSESDIGSPVVHKPSAVIAMNLPSLDKYEPLIQLGGVLVVNSSLVDRRPERDDITSIMVPANEIAEEIGDSRLANMVTVGALMQRTGYLTPEQVGISLRKHIAEQRRDLLEPNMQALQRGAQFGMS